MDAGKSAGADNRKTASSIQPADAVLPGQISFPGARNGSCGGTYFGFPNTDQGNIKHVERLPAKGFSQNIL